MGDVELPPDPYLALGVSKDADAAAIKTAYRKLVLKCHPDKVPDPAAKQAAADKFHIIQTSYERLIDEKARARYDAEVKLAELRKERFSQRAPEPRATRTHQSSHESTRPSPQDYRSSTKAAPTYEERRPAYAEYADAPTRPTRKESDYERLSRRASHDVKEKVRASVREVKEAERADRREKAKKTTKDTRRDREQKYRPTYVEGSTSDDSDSDANVHAPRRAAADRETRRRDDERRAQDYLHEQARHSRQESAEEYFFGDRARKLFTQHESAREYMNKAARGRQASDVRPTPGRSGSSRDPIHEYGPKGERPAYISRRTSTREPPSRREPDSIPRSIPRDRERDRYSSSEEAPPPRTRPTTLNQSRSSPNEIHIPSDKPRAQSLQHNTDPFDPPRVRRAETMPLNPSRGRTEKSYRATEFHDGLATPGTTPEYGGPPQQSKYRYTGGYADDYPPPDGSRPAEPYYTEVREPAREGRRTENRDSRPEFSRGMTRSPSPVKEVREPRRVREARDLRTNSARYVERPPRPPLNTRTTSYKYDERAGGVESLPIRSRPTSARESSYRGQPSGRLFGEVSQPPTSTRSPQRVPSEDRYQRSFRPEDIKFESGYQTKTTSPDRPPVGRNSSNIVYAR